MIQLVSRVKYDPLFNFSEVYGEWAQVESVELINDGSGLAFGIVGGRSSGVVIKTILPGGVADRDGRLRSGDQILRIGCVWIVGMCARQAAAVLRQCGTCVRILVARPADALTNQSLGASPAPIIPSKLICDPVELENYLVDKGYEGFSTLPPSNQDLDPADGATIIEERMLMKPIASIVAVVPRGALKTPPQRLPAVPTTEKSEDSPPAMRLPLDMALCGGEPESLSFSVELDKDVKYGLGITVAGYVCEQEDLSGIFVKSVSKGSSADLSGQIQVNDRIVEVDGVSLNGVTNHKAVALLRDAQGPKVVLKVIRYLRGARFERIKRALNPSSYRSSIGPPSPSVTSLTKYSFSVYEESTIIEPEQPSDDGDLASPSNDQEIVIMEDAKTDEDCRAIQDKWRELLETEPDWPGYDDPYDVVVATVVKGANEGLGISLEGTVRVEGGRELAARHYLRALAPNGVVARAGVHRPGDELLEVNGIRILGMHHVDVVSTLRNCGSCVTLACARRMTNETRVIGTGQDVKAFCSRNLLHGSLQNLMSPPKRMIKAKSESSVASLTSRTTVISPSDKEFQMKGLSEQKSRSLEPLSGLAMWSDHVTYVNLVKEDRGLGFSILDYLDPCDSSRTVIVVRSVVSGGAAAAKGAPTPGDRLLSVNGVDVSRADLAVAVAAIKAAPKGVVRIGVAKPLPSSAIVGGGEKVNDGASISSQELNSIASDDHTGFDSYHECLQEYQENLEVVQICMEPDDISIKEDLSDVSIDDSIKNNDFSTLKKKNNEGSMQIKQVNGIKSSKSDYSLGDDDTITEELETPRELPDKKHYINNRSVSADQFNGKNKNKTLANQQSKDVSTSDEMVFAVTPSGLERISFEKYWKECERSAIIVDEDLLEKVKSDESWKDLNSQTDTESFVDVTRRNSVHNSLLFIDHEIDGYETCLDDESNSLKVEVNVNKETPNDKQVINKDETNNERVIKQMLPFNIQPIVFPPNSSKVKLVEYYNDQQQCLEEIKRKQNTEELKHKSNTKHRKKFKVTKVNDRIKINNFYNDEAECWEEIKSKEKVDDERSRLIKEREEKIRKNKSIFAKRYLIKNQEPSEESTDLEVGYPVPGCHKCFLENYEYELKKYIAEASACKFCDVLREILEPPKTMLSKSRSAPALAAFDTSSISETEDEDHNLMVPVVQIRRKSAGPLRFLVPYSRKSSYAPPLPSPTPKMTVALQQTSDTAHEADTNVGKEPTDRWGLPRAVTLNKDGYTSLGISIVGGRVDLVGCAASKDDQKPIFGIFIKTVVPDTPAGLSGQLQPGDRIIEVEGVCVKDAPHERAVQLIKSAGDSVTLTVQSLLSWQSDWSTDSDARSASPAPSVKRKSPSPPVQQPQTPEHEIKITVTLEADVEPEKDTDVEKPKEEKKQVYSDSSSSDDDDDEEDNRELEGRTYSEKGAEIDRASAAAVKRSKEEKEADPEQEDEFGYTTNKIRKKYGNLGEVVLVKLERSPKAGLGLSLAGHRDRTRMAVFVCGLNPTGSAAKSSLNIADEILEVNGVVLHGRCHLNASAIIKGLPGPVFKIVVLRRKQAIEDLAVKPITQFPVAIEEDGEDRYAGYKGVRHISIKKGSSSLGIMIIEGRHQEVGQGIFISDIQEGSPAEQAGLQIGDLILAVNKDSLLGASYDSAAGLLKRTEGIVVLTVCNPNKKIDSPTKEIPVNRAASTEPKGLEPRALTPGPKPAASPARSLVVPPPDPLTAPILPNVETLIEIATNSKSLGCIILGGSDTLLNGGAVILEVYKDGAAGKDGRLKSGDQILECEGVKITKEMTHERVCLTIKRNLPRIRMTVFRPEPIKFDTVEVELTRKPGKGIGLAMMAMTPPPGVYISDLIPGGTADLDGRLQRGDIIIAVDGKDVSKSTQEDVASCIKSLTTKANISVKRFKLCR